MPEEGPTGEPAEEPYSDEPLPPDEDAIIDEGLDSEIITDIARREYPTYAKIGLIVGALVLFAGGLMIKVGLGGPVDLTIPIGGSEMHLNTVVVGVVIAVIGAVIFIVARRGLIAKKDGKG